MHTGTERVKRGMAARTEQHYDQTLAGLLV